MSSTASRGAACAPASAFVSRPSTTNPYRCSAPTSGRLRGVTRMGSLTRPWAGTRAVSPSGKRILHADSSSCASTASSTSPSPGILEHDLILACAVTAHVERFEVETWLGVTFDGQDTVGDLLGAAAARAHLDADACLLRDTLDGGLKVTGTLPLWPGNRPSVLSGELVPGWV